MAIKPANVTQLGLQLQPRLLRGLQPGGGILQRDSEPAVRGCEQHARLGPGRLPVPLSELSAT